MDKKKMKICERAKNFIQVYDVDGSVRICGWTRDGYIGKLTEHSLLELYNSPKALAVRNRHVNEDYSLCKVDACPFLAMNTIEEHLVDYTGDEKYPDWLYIGFEQICNYSCRCCTLHQTMQNNKCRNLEENYRIISERIREVLPKIKRISANGCGELFASKHTLKLLNEWNPEAPIEECSVTLETNGSLFDDAHWKQIENLGNYNLHVAISVMSFNDDIYKYLSGTNLPVSQIEKNLKYVRELREKNIINHLEIATVVQEQNFREMPYFAKRCIEEFGADTVRLRPYEPWGAESSEVAWFTDVRNPHHPLYEEYKKTMSHPYLKHPKVKDWGGGLDSEWASLPPAELAEIKLGIITELSVNDIEIIKKIKDITNNNKIIIYGLSSAARVLKKILSNTEIEIVAFIDRNPYGGEYEGIPILSLNDASVSSSPVVITTVPEWKKIKLSLSKKGFSNIYHLSELLTSGELYNRLIKM